MARGIKYQARYRHVLTRQGLDMATTHKKGFIYLIEQVSLYDTTFRDGAQTEGVSFSTEDKLEILSHLDAFGIDFVEGGYPGSNPKDKAFFKAARQVELKQLQTGGLRLHLQDQASWPGRTRRIQVAARGEHRVGLHLRQVLGPACDEGAGRLAGGEPGASSRTASLSLRKEGQAGHLRRRALLRRLEEQPRVTPCRSWTAAKEAGAEWLVLCDTNGGYLPSEVARGGQAMS